MYRLLFPLFLTAGVLSTGSIQLPKNFKTCSRHELDLNDCLKSAIQSGLLELKKGSRPLGVLPIDPLELTTLSIGQGSGPVAINLDFKDLHIQGITKSIVESVEAHMGEDVKTLKITTRSDDVLALVGNYTVKGKVLILPVVGSGKSTIELNETMATIKFTGKTVKKNGNTHLIFTTVEMDLNPKKLKFNFENLFNGDKALGDHMNLFINENWMEIYGELKDPINKAFGLTFIEITNKILGKVEFDDIFPQ